MILDTPPGGAVIHGPTPPHHLLQGYLDEKVSLGKVAETLGVSRFELMERFDHLGVPITIGPRNLEEARADVEAVRKAR